MTLEELRTTRRAQIVSLAERSGAHNVRVFGSIDLDQGRSLLDLGRLQRGIEVLQEQKVDVASARGLRAQVWQRIFRDAVPI